MIDLRLEARQNPIEGLPGGVPALRILAHTRGRTDEPRTGSPSKYLCLGAGTTISIGGVAVPVVASDGALRYGQPIAGTFDQEIKWTIPLPRYLIEAIEAQRTDDVLINIAMEVHYHTVGGNPLELFGAVWPSLQLKVSQKEWLDALASMGFRSGWILEVDRPEVEGWDQAKSFLGRAAERIAARDPEGAVAQCRAAWRAVDPFIDAEKVTIAAEVDRGSTTEGGYPPKSERADDLRVAIRSWTNTGAHPENYAASMEDALLAYRLTASLIAFLSRRVTPAVARERSGGQE